IFLRASSAVVEALAVADSTELLILMIFKVRFAMLAICALVIPLSMMGVRREELHHWCPQSKQNSRVYRYRDWELATSDLTRWRERLGLRERGRQGRLFLPS